MLLQNVVWAIAFVGMGLVASGFLHVIIQAGKPADDAATAGLADGDRLDAAAHDGCGGGGAVGRGGEVRRRAAADWRAAGDHWPRAGFVVRGMFPVEVVATAFRMGWLYMVSPLRLCSNYLLGDQQQLGKIMLAIGGARCLLPAWKLVWGRIDIDGAQER